MNVLIICNFSSGLYTFRGKLIEKLIAEGNSVKAIVPETTDENEKIAQAKIKDLGCMLYHVSMERRGMNPVKDIGLFVKYIGVLKETNPDFVITYTIKPNIYGSMACRIVNLFRKEKIQYAVNITGLGSAFENQGVLKRMVCLLYKIALRKAKVVFFENEENRQILLDMGLLKEEQSFLLAGAGVDLEHFQYSEYPNNDETRFLFIGRVMKEKGVDELFVAMKELVAKGINAKLDIVGGFEEDYSKVLEQFNSEGRIAYHGYQNDVRPFIEKCNCFVLPSWHEGMANTNLECASMGRPVITSNIPGCREAVINGESGFLCETKDAKSLSEKMERFSKLTFEEKKRMGACGRKHMEENFDKEKVVNMTINKLFEARRER